MADSTIKYFLFSSQQLNEKNTIEATIGKKFVPGTVVVNGTRKKFTQISDSQVMARFPDVDVVASGYLDKMVYTKPTTETK